LEYSGRIKYLQNISVAEDDLFSGINQIVRDCPSHELGMVHYALIVHFPVGRQMLGSGHAFFERGFLMKTWMKVVLGIVAGFAALLALIFWLTGDITKTGDDFFAAVQNDDMDTAYALLSEDFQTGTSKEELKSYLEANALDDVKETSWGSRFMTGGTGELEGTVTTKDGTKIPLKLRLIDSEAGWRINAIEKASAGFKESAGAQPLPSVEKQQQLFRKTIGVYAETRAERSMKKFWDHFGRSFS